MLEIFLELLTVRLQMIEKSVDIPNDMFECLASLVYAASRVQVSPSNTCQVRRGWSCQALKKMERLPSSCTQKLHPYTPCRSSLPQRCQPARNGGLAREGSEVALWLCRTFQSW